MLDKNFCIVSNEFVKDMINISSNAVKIYILFKSMTNEKLNGNVVWPSYSYITKNTGVRKSSIPNALLDLVKRGWINQIDKGFNSVNHYYINDVSDINMVLTEKRLRKRTIKPRKNTQIPIPSSPKMGLLPIPSSPKMGLLQEDDLNLDLIDKKQIIPDIIPSVDQNWDSTSPKMGLPVDQKWDSNNTNIIILINNINIKRKKRIFKNPYFFKKHYRLNLKESAVKYISDSDIFDILENNFNINIPDKFKKLNIPVDISKLVTIQNKLDLMNEFPIHDYDSFQERSKKKDVLFAQKNDVVMSIKSFISYAVNQDALESLNV